MVMRLWCAKHHFGTFDDKRTSSIADLRRTCSLCAVFSSSTILITVLSQLCLNPTELKSLQSRQIAVGNAIGLSPYGRPGCQRRRRRPGWSFPWLGSAFRASQICNICMIYSRQMATIKVRHLVTGLHFLRLMNRFFERKSSSGPPHPMGPPPE